MKRYIIPLLFVLSFAIFISCNETVRPALTVNSTPSLFPDYVGVTVPSSVAPLNFRMADDSYDKIDVVVTGKNRTIHVQRDHSTFFSPRTWKKLLAENKGGKITLTVSAKRNGKWIRYASFPIYVSQFAIDEGLVYRLIAPSFEAYGKMGIYERSLSSFRQRTLIENTLVPNSCINCHSFQATNPDSYSFHICGNYGATALKLNDKTELFNMKNNASIGSYGYSYWHPTGEFIAYAVNKSQRLYHVVRDKRVEVVDLASDIVLYDVKKNQLFSCPQLKSNDAFETSPAFSPDGRSLYFCSAKARPLEQYAHIRYSLCRISFDPDKGIFGDKVDTLVNADKLFKSVSFPRPSYDGSYLMYTISDYGNSSIWHREADLRLIDLRTGSDRALSEVNSSDAESYHSWSSNSHWFVFSSRRIDGLYTRLYLASIDDKGRITKPFLLPQKDPDQNESSFYSFNLPEFVSGTVKMDTHQIQQQALSKERRQMQVR